MIQPTTAILLKKKPVFLFYLFLHHTTSVDHKLIFYDSTLTVNKHSNKDHNRASAKPMHSIRLSVCYPIFFTSMQLFSRPTPRNTKNTPEVRLFLRNEFVAKKGNTSGVKFNSGKVSRQRTKRSGPPPALNLIRRRFVFSQFVTCVCGFRVKVMTSGWANK